MLDIERERDIERLRRVALLQKSELERLAAMLARKCAELAKLKGSEDELQGTLKLLEDARIAAANADARARDSDERAPERDDAAADRPHDDQPRGDTPAEPQRGHGPNEQLALERVPLRCELDEADRVCPSCSGHLHPLAGQAERSELIDVVELQYRLVQVERQKYVCKCGSTVQTAPGPERAIDGGRYSLKFALKVAFDKYVAHLPLERQVRLMAHHGLRITSQTLWDQCSAVTPLLEPTYDALFARLRAGPVLGVDQTSWPDLEDKTLPPWQMWCLTAPGIVYHRICDDKSKATFKDLLGDYRGWVVADALGTHEAGARECRGLRLAACWAHVLRRFRDAVADFPEAKLALAWIHDLYAIDSRATCSEERRRLRKTESRAVLDKLHAWLVVTPALTSTSLGTAIRYTLRIWSRLTMFVDDPELWLDNNPTERGLRGPVLGRRNHFGSKSPRGTRVAAIMYSLVESAKVSGVDPIAYLLETATRARRSPGAVLLPDDYKAAERA